MFVYRGQNFVSGGQIIDVVIRSRLEHYPEPDKNDTFRLEN